MPEIRHESTEILDISEHINYFIYEIYPLVKTIRLVDHKLHSELLKVLGEIQSKTGKSESMDSVIRILLKKYGRKV